jgi:hypothetical protein
MDKQRLFMLFIEDEFFVSFFLNLHDGLGVDVQKEVVRDELRVALHLEARPICCIRGLKSSLVIGQKAQIGPISLHLEAGPIWWYVFFN